MNVSALVLVLIVILIESGIIVCNKFIKKITNYYWFWLAIGFFCTVWFLVWKQIPDFNAYLQAKSSGQLNNPSDYVQSMIISKAFLTQTCPFFAFIIPLLLMADPTRKTARATSPIGIFASSMVFLELILSSSTENYLTAKYIFLGDSQNPLYFWYHFTTLTISIGVLLNTPKFEYRWWPSVILAIVVNYCYTAIIMASTGCAWAVSGLSSNDWSETGTFWRLTKLFNLQPKHAPLVFVPIFWIISFGNVLLKDLVFDRFKWFKYPSERSDQWYRWYNISPLNFKKKM